MSEFYLLEKGYFLWVEFHDSFGWVCKHTENPDEAMIFRENDAFVKTDLIQTLIERGHITKVNVLEYNTFKIF